MNLNHVAKKAFFDLFYRTPCMAQLLRAALYDATRVGADGKPTGPRAHMILSNQRAIAKSPELAEAFQNLREIFENGNHVTRMLGPSDVIQLGGYAAVEYCGGPQMIFQMGRQDIAGEKSVVQHEQETHYGSMVVTGLTKQGLSPEEFVAMMGSQTIGFNGDAKKGLHTRWTKNPFVFDNTYFQEILLGEKSKYFQAEADMRLVQTPELRSWVEKYADDQELFFTNYAKAHVKLSERTHEATLMSEFDSMHQIGGGYHEPPRHRINITVLKALFNQEEGIEEWQEKNMRK